jgi:hypothetical protein
MSILAAAGAGRSGARRHGNYNGELDVSEDSGGREAVSKYIASMVRCILNVSMIQQINGVTRILANKTRRVCWRPWTWLAQLGYQKQREVVQYKATSRRVRY